MSSIPTILPPNTTPLAYQVELAIDLASCTYQFKTSLSLALAPHTTAITRLLAKHGRRPRVPHRTGHWMRRFLQQVVFFHLRVAQKVVPRVGDLCARDAMLV